MKRPPLGAHVSIAGGYQRALDRGAELGCDTLQIFVASPGQWRLRPLARGEAARFRRAHATSPIGLLVAHAAYLINPAAADRTVLARSRRALAAHLDRCDRLGVDFLVLHPGAHMGRGETAGLERAADTLARVLDRHRGPTRLLLETTAGQGTVLGHRLEQLAEIRRLTGRPDRLGVCVDTCHVFAAGYAVHQARGYRRFLIRLRALFGPTEPSALHLNDSRTPFASHRDRHANLGHGAIGTALFKRLLRDPSLRKVPMILETPRGSDGQGHARDLTLLREIR